MSSYAMSCQILIRKEIIKISGTKDYTFSHHLQYLFLSFYLETCQVLFSPTNASSSTPMPAAFK